MALEIPINLITLPAIAFVLHTPSARAPPPQITGQFRAQSLGSARAGAVAAAVAT